MEGTNAPHPEEPALAGVSKDAQGSLQPKSYRLSVFLYILLCADGSYYVGIARANLERRIAEHNNGLYVGYTASRRPVKLVFCQEFQRLADAIAAERQVKGWRRQKKEALIRGELHLLSMLASRAARSAVRPSRRAPAKRSSG
jgi:predicted GIY-YIG superfamily endonuclease